MGIQIPTAQLKPPSEVILKNQTNKPVLQKEKIAALSLIIFFTIVSALILFPFAGLPITLYIAGIFFILSILLTNSYLSLCKKPQDVDGLTKSFLKQDHQQVQSTLSKQLLSLETSKEELLQLSLEMRLIFHEILSDKLMNSKEGAEEATDVLETVKQLQFYTKYLPLDYFGRLLENICNIHLELQMNETKKNALSLLTQTTRQLAQSYSFKLKQEFLSAQIMREDLKNVFALSYKKIRTSIKDEVDADIQEKKCSIEKALSEVSLTLSNLTVFFRELLQRHFEKSILENSFNNS